MLSRLNTVCLAGNYREEKISDEVSHHKCCHLELNVVKTDSCGDFGKGGKEQWHVQNFPEVPGGGGGQPPPMFNW